MAKYDVRLILQQRS